MTTGLAFPLLNPAMHFMVGFITLHISVCLSVDTISQKVCNQSTSFLVVAFPVTHVINQ